jgi:hypothetical protein
VAAAASAASAVLGVAAQAAPAAAAAYPPVRPGDPGGDEPDTPQGGKAPLHGPGGRPAKPQKLRETTRAEIIRRAGEWVAARVPYSMHAYWPDGYRQDCSGFVSMAWNLPGNEWTGSLGRYARRITRQELQPGDILLFHNPADPQRGSHVVIFGGWADRTRTSYVAYEEARPTARRRVTPYPYWSNGHRYVPYRYKGVKAGAAGGEAGPKAPSARPSFPGAAYFGPGANNTYVTLLGQLLAKRGAGRLYTSGPGPRWTDADRRAVQAFQRAQGWTGTAADGLPGPRTWALLVDGRGRDVPAAARGTAATGTPGKPATGTSGKPAAVPPFPGRGMFRPGADNAHVTRLGRQLVKKGFGAHYTSGPGPRWGEGDRRNVEAFQRAQGWRGGTADGYPGPETWRRLFS